MWTSVECPDDVDEGSATITDVTETSYIIDGLREGTSYTITVSATKSASTSPSDPVTRATGELGEYVNSLMPNDILLCATSVCITIILMTLE